KPQKVSKCSRSEAAVPIRVFRFGLKSKKAALKLRQLSLFLKEFLHSFKKTSVSFPRVGFKVWRISQFFEKGFLLSAKMFGRPDVHMDQLIAFVISINVFDTFAAKPQYLAALCAAFDFNFDLTLNSRHFDLRAEGSIDKTDVEIVNNIVAVSFQQIVLLLFD